MPLNINTNLTSLIVQSNLDKSTSALNRAIERMTTGFKINGAKDNAANYGISVQMSTKISAYEVAEDNVSTGIDMVSTASGALDIISDRLARLRALSEQAANGTYGEDSLRAINAEVSALVEEIYRVKNTTEFNGQQICGGSMINEDTIGAQGLTVKENGFMLDFEVRDVSGMTTMASVDENAILAKGVYSISSAEELAKLSRMQNAEKVEAGSEFVLGADIDLSDYSTGSGWKPIACSSNWDNRFEGVFDGNGYTISNLYVNNKGLDASLLGRTQNAVIKNLGIVNGFVSCIDRAGAILGFAQETSIINCYVKDVEAVATSKVAGGLFAAAYQNVSVDHCYATGDASAVAQAGGLIGFVAGKSTVTNSFATGNVKSSGTFSAGLVGFMNGESLIDNCFASGDVFGDSRNEIRAIGGLCGICAEASITNSHASGNVKVNSSSSDFSVGGLIGQALEMKFLENCYATGNVDSNVDYTGGLIGALIHESSGSFSTSIKNCFASGNVNSTGMGISALIGRVYRTELEMTNCYSTGDVSGKNYTAGLIGTTTSSPLSITNSYSTGNINGANYTGGLCGYSTSASIFSNVYVSGTVSASGAYTGGLLGYASSLNADNCYVLGKLDGVKAIFAGYLNSSTISNSYYSSLAEENGLKFVNSGNAVVEDSVEYNDTVPFSFNTNTVGLQVGIYSDSSSRLSVDTSFSLGELKEICCLGVSNSNILEKLDDLIGKISAKQVELGAVENRLMSAMEEINIHYDNLVASRSTIKDADIAEESSAYIRNQILQQAGATLLSTANQSPALALQLL